MNAGRDTVEWSAGVQGRSWRRVTDGDPCAFCAMLATRSDYTTKERALTTGHTRRHKRGGKRPLGSKYHDHCGCTVVEVVGPWNQIGLMSSIRGRMRRLVSGLMITVCSSRLAIF